MGNPRSDVSLYCSGHCLPSECSRDADLLQQLTYPFAYLENWGEAFDPGSEFVVTRWSLARKDDPLARQVLLLSICNSEISGREDRSSESLF